MFNRVPSPIRPLIGREFDEDSLEKAFKDANVRQWYLRVERGYGDTSITHFYTTERLNRTVEWRDWYKENLSKKFAAEFGAAVAGLDPKTLTLQNMAAVLAKATGNSMAMMEKFEKEVFQPELNKMEKILDGEFSVFDRIKYKINTASLPYLDKADAPSTMWHALVKNDVLQKVVFRPKDGRAFQ